MCVNVSGGEMKKLIVFIALVVSLYGCDNPSVGLHTSSDGAPKYTTVDY